jgi:hypothetical protein
MFEHSLYEPETVPTPTAEGDLFHDYEIKSWDLGPRAYKILGISAAANLLAVLVVAQTSLLTMKGCDSPLVGGVCQVLDTVYVGAMLWGTDREFVDAAYDKTELEDADITFVDVSGVTPPMSYPEGYFQVANPVQYQQLLDMQNNPASADQSFIAPGIPFTRPGQSLIDTPAVIPTPNPNIISGNLPTFGGSDTGSNPTLTRPRRGARANPVKPVEDTTAKTDDDQKTDDKTEPTVDPMAPESGVEINKRPFVDLANYINELIDKNQVKLDSQFLLTATGKLDKTGKLDPKTFKFGKEESPDRKLIEVVKEAVEAMNDSNLLQYLSMLKGNQLGFQIQQDDLNVAATVQTDFETAERAQSMATVIKLFLDNKKKEKEAPDASPDDKDDLALLQNATVTPTGKRLVISFNIPKADLQTMIQRKLAEQKAQPKPQNGNSMGNNNSNSAQKQN